MNDYYGIKVKKKLFGQILTFSKSLAARDSRTDFALKSKTIYHTRLAIKNEEP